MTPDGQAKDFKTVSLEVLDIYQKDMKPLHYQCLRVRVEHGDLDFEHLLRDDPHNKYVLNITEIYQAKHHDCPVLGYIIVGEKPES